MNRRLASVAALLFMVACADRAQAPVARAVVSAQAHVGARLVLDGSSSSSQARRDGPPLELHYAWALESAPDGSTARIEHPDLARATIVPDLVGRYRVRLVVSDGAFDSDPMSVDFTADDACRPTAESLSATPAAPAVGQDVALLATPAAGCEADGAGTITAWKWTLVSAPAGSAAQVLQSNTAAASFRPDVRGDYVLAVQLTNGLGVTTNPDDPKARLTVTASACGDNAPHVRAIHSTPAAPNVGDLVQLQADVEHADLNPPCSLDRSLHYEWSVRSLPRGALIELNDAKAANPSFYPEIPGDYVLSLVVGDDLGHQSAPAEYTVSVSTCGFATPVARVTAPATTFVGDVVALGTTLDDTDATACALSPKYTYLWSLAIPAGSKAKLDDPTRASPTFVPDVAGTYTPSVVVTSSNGKSSSRAFASVTSAACGSLAPLPNIHAPQGAATAQAVSFSATVVDPNDTCVGPGPVTYAWTFASRPAGSRARLSGSDEEGVSAQVSPSIVPDRAGDYVVQLVATNHTGLHSLPVTATITAAECTAPLAVAIDVPSGAGTGLPVGLRAHVTDPNEPGPGASCARPVFPFQYAWRLVGLPAGSHAALSAPNASAPSFVPDVEGSYDVELTVTDAAGNRGTGARASVVVSSCRAPLDASIEAPNGAATGLPVAFSATVADPNAPTSGGSCTAAVFPYSYAWSLVGAPAGSHAAFNEPSASAPSFVPDVAGTYAVQLVVTDAAGNRSRAALATLTVAECRAPLTASISAPSGAATGKVVALSATVDDPNTPASTNACTRAVTPFTYGWQLVGRPPQSRAALNSRVVAAPTFVPDFAGTYTVQLVVTDAAGNTSPVATADIVAADCSAPLTATIGAPAGAATRQPVALTATVTNPNDPATNSDCSAAVLPMKYRWNLVGRPAGSSAALNSSEAASPSFTPDVPGTYSVTLAVADAAGRASGLATADVVVADCGAPLTTVVNASATGISGVPYALDATVTDPNGACGTVLPYRYAWTLVARPSGSAATLNSAAASAPSFTPDVAGAYVVALRVTDALGNTGPAASATVNVIACNAPISVSLNLPTSAATGAPVALGATVTDPNAPDGGVCTAAVTPFSFAWAFVERPAGSSAVFNSTMAANPSFTPDVAGTYTVALVVTDAAGNRSPLTTGSFLATSCTAAPQVSIAAVPGATTGVPVPLTSAVVDPNAAAGCASLLQPYAYSWVLESVPTGSAARLNSDVATSPSFTPDVSGDYVVSLVVTDAAGQRSAVARQTINAAICNAAPTVAIGGPASASSGDVIGLAATITDPNDPATNPTCAAGVTPFAYQWTILDQPAGSEAALNATDAAAPSFVADLGGAYTIGLVVTDANGNKSTLAKHTINVVGCNLAPTVAVTSAGGPGTVTLGATVTDNNPASCGAGASRTYRWALVAAPSHSVARIDLPTAPAPSFYADAGGTYVVALQVTDARGNVANVEKALAFSSCGAGPTVSVAAPAAPILGEAVELAAKVTDASATTCGSATSAPFEYAWQLVRPSGSVAVIDGGALGTFVADVAGTYTWTLTVTDAFGLRTSTSGSVVVRDCTLTPSIAVGKPSPVLTYSPVPLTGTVTRANATCTNAYTTRWRVVRGPQQSSATFSTRTGLQTNFTPDVPNASWEIRLEVTDLVTGATRGIGASILSNGCGAAGPTAAPGISLPFPIAQNNAQTSPLTTPTAAYLTGYTLQLDGTGSSDPSAACAGPLTYRWSMYARPVNSTSAPTPENAAKPSFPLDVTGDFVVRLVVSDGRFTSAPSFLHVVVEDPLNDKIPGLPSTRVLWNDSAADPATNNPSVAFYQLNSGTNRYDLKFAKCTANCDAEGAASSWQISTIDTNLINPSDSLASTVQVSLIYLAPGVPAVAYKSSVTCDFRYAVFNGTGWNRSIIDNNISGTIGSPCGSIHGEIELRLVGAAQVPAVAYHTHNPLGAKYAVCKTGCTTGTSVTWASQVINAGNNVGHYITFQVDPTTKLPRLAYQEDVSSFSNPEPLHYATCADGAGSCAAATGTWTDKVIATGDTAYWNSMDIAPNGTVGIATQDVANSQVRLYTCTSNCGSASASTWTFRGIETITTGDAVPRLQYDANNLARITYINPGLSTKPLRYAVQTGATTFNFFDIDRQVDDGHSSFILTPAGSTHVSYALTTGLKYYPFGD